MDAIMFLRIGIVRQFLLSLFGTGPCWGWSAQELLGWIHYGGGKELYKELMGNLDLNLVGFFNSPMPAQPLGWFKEQIKDASQMKGLKYRTVGLAADVLGVDGNVRCSVTRWRNSTCNEKWFN